MKSNQRIYLLRCVVLKHGSSRCRDGANAISAILKETITSL